MNGNKHQATVKKPIQWLEGEHFRADLFDQEALAEAGKWIYTKEELNKQKWSRNRPGDGKLTRTQLRRYYQEIKHLERRYLSLKSDRSEESQQKAWDATLPLLKMVKAKVAYDSRDSEKLPKEFSAFIRRCVDSVRGPRDFEAFVKHFEAVVGYYYGEAKVPK